MNSRFLTSALLLGGSLIALAGCGGQSSDQAAQEEHGTGALVKDLDFVLEVVGDDGRPTRLFRTSEPLRAHLWLVNRSDHALVEPSSVAVWYLDVRNDDGTLDPDLVYHEHRLGVAGEMLVIPAGATLDLGVHTWNQVGDDGRPVSAGLYTLEVVTDRLQIGGGIAISGPG